MIVDTETMSFEALPNTSQYAPSGAGIQAAQTIANKGVKLVLTGSVGPNAFQVLSSAGIDIITGVYGMVREAVEKFKRGQLKRTSAPTTPIGVGVGGGFGMGMGRGGGRGMGFRRWQAAGPFVPQVPVSAPATHTVPPRMSKEQKILILEKQLESLQQHLDRIRKRLKELSASR